MENEPDNASNELEITQDGLQYFKYVNNKLTQPQANSSRNLFLEILHIQIYW